MKLRNFSGIYFCVDIVLQCIQILWIFKISLGLIFCFFLKLLFEIWTENRLEFVGNLQTSYMRVVRAQRFYTMDNVMWSKINGKMVWNNFHFMVISWKIFNVGFGLDRKRFYGECL